MSTLPPVLHRSVRAITPNEFLEALQATCAPRFPGAQGRTHQPIAVAVSGGVDSMALAYLCAKIRPTSHWFKVADHPVSHPIGLIIDHGMREGSAAEATKVADAIRPFGLKPTIMTLRWADVIGKGSDPSKLPNVETLARYLRYRRLGQFCRNTRVAALLTAHHEDDQYETVMMRLLSGHGFRGLQGMRPATDIPECYDLHGVYQSGFVDDQRLQQPFYNLRPNGKERKHLKRGLKRELDPAVLALEIERGLKSDVATAYLEDDDDNTKNGKPTPRLVPLEIENGGVMVYRPLLRFSKDRLIATCLENGIPWFEDHTNADQTLTMRNAVRHMHKNHRLPEALQKPSVLRLAERCRARVISAEAEAERLLGRVIIHEFTQNTGTVMVTLPRINFPTVPGRLSSSPTHRRRRIEHYRHIAALLIRKLMSMVTPERELSQPAQLNHLVSMLFPSLADEANPAPEPKAYVICSVHFAPLFSKGHASAPRWLITRAPHVSNVPRPALTFAGHPLSKRLDKHPRKWKTSGWTDTRLYDGRYWIRVLHRLPCRLRVAPLEPEYHKPFRDALNAADGQARKDLAAILRRHAPGKIRYTLPALYAAVDVSDVLAGGDWWPPHLHMHHHPSSSASVSSPAPEISDDEPLPPIDEHEVVLGIRESNLSSLHTGRLLWERKLKSKADPEKPALLLALPTLGVALPGLEDWVRWEVRYRKVDEVLLRQSRRGGWRVERGELRRRVRLWYRRVRLGWGRRAIAWRGLAGGEDGKRVGRRGV